MSRLVINVIYPETPLKNFNEREGGGRCGAGHDSEFVLLKISQPTYSTIVFLACPNKSQPTIFSMP